jgi:hypothetical protein
MFGESIPSGSMTDVGEDLTVAMLRSVGRRNDLLRFLFTCA